MNILFIHQNFPGQFLHLAPALAARGHKVIALADKANEANPKVVPIYYYRSPQKGRHKGLGATFVDAAERGQMVVGACSQLTERTGFRPDVIFGHNGWGEMLFLREVWPEARILNYAELVYRSRGLDSDFDPEHQKADLNARTATTSRAAHIHQSMIDADGALSPTAWQAASFPADLRAKIRVIHDGVNSDEICPNPNAQVTITDRNLTLRAGDEVMTFVNRNLEPYRGYHTFMRALPEVLAARPKAQVVIVGGDQVSYGPPPASGTWKDTYLNEVRDRLDLTRVHFVGRLSRAQLTALLQVTRVHAYLTYPFVLSWSMIEALSAGALVVASDTGPVREIIEDGINGRLVDFFDIKGWSQALIRALATPEADAPLRANARATVLAKYDLQRQCLPALIAFVEGFSP